MKQDKWTQQLHDKLAEHEMAAPDDLWADIEAALEQAPVSPSHRGKSRFVALRRWAAAAAVAALMLGGGYLWFSQSTTALQAESDETANIERTDDEPKPETVVEEQPKLLAKLETEKKTTTTTKTTTKTATETPPTEPTTPPYEKSEEEPPMTPATPAEEKPERQLTTDEPRRPAQGATVRKQQQYVTLGLHATNGLGSQTNSNPVQMADGLIKQYDDLYTNPYAAARSSERAYLTGFEERQHHHQPIAYGLTLGYPLTARLSLTTGLVYTKLVSDFTQVMRNMQIQRQQTLHYVGIPLNLNYSLWSSRRFKAYLSAGTAAYWNVATRLVTDGVKQQMDKDRLQWSLSGSLGLQYDLLPQIGIYAEPGLSYYPDNGSRLQNYFKDKPTTLNLQLGLRMNIGRW